MRQSTNGVILVVICVIVRLLQAQDVAQKLITMANNHHVKLVFARNNSDKVIMTQTDQRSDSTFVLCGYDTKTGTVDTILGKMTNYTRPLITYDGKRVVYSNQRDGQIHIVDWNGANERIITKGMAGTLFYDPTTKKEYIVHATSSSFITAAPVYGTNINDTTEKFLLRRGLGITPEWLCITSDAKYLGGAFGYPSCALKSIPVDSNDNSIAYISGCWPSIVFGTYYFCVFNDTHQGFNIWRGGGIWEYLPLIVGDHAKWATYYRNFLVLTTPTKTQPGNVTVIKFDNAITKIVDTVFVTKNLRDLCPDVWVGDTAVTEFLKVIEPVEGSIIKTGQTITVKYDYSQDFRNSAGRVTVDLFIKNGMKKFKLTPIQNNNDSNKICFDSSWHKAPSFYIAAKMVCTSKETLSVIDDNAYFEVCGTDNYALGGHKKSGIFKILDESANKNNIQIQLSEKFPFITTLNNNILHVVFDNPEYKEICIINMLGKKIYTIQGDSRSFAFPGFRQGVYIIQVKTRTALTRKKCVLME